MKAVALMPMLFAAAGCGGSTTDRNAQAVRADVAFPAVGAADAVRTAKPGTAPVATPTAMSTPSPTSSASATP